MNRSVGCGTEYYQRFRQANEEVLRLPPNSEVLHDGSQNGTFILPNIQTKRLLLHLMVFTSFQCDKMKKKDEDSPHHNVFFFAMVPGRMLRI